MCRAFLFVALSIALQSAGAVEKRDLPLFTAKAAAEVKAAIPGAKAEIQGTIAVVKKNTVPGPKSSSMSAAGTTGKTAEIPAANGCIIAIIVDRYWAKQRFGATGPAVKAPAMPKTPVFDRAKARLVSGSYHTTGVQVFENSNVVITIDIWFGQSMDTPTLEAAYGALTQFAAGELK